MLKNLKSAVTTVANELYMLARQAGGEALGKAMVEKAKDTIFVDKRAELLETLSDMDEKDTDNIRSRIDEADKSHTENRFTTLLCKITKEKRKDTLVWLNRLGDDEFDQMLNLLEHDPIQQFLARMTDKIKEVVPKIKEVADEAAVEVENVNEELEKVLAQVTTWADGKKKGGK